MQVWQAIHVEGADSRLWPSAAVTTDHKCMYEILLGVKHLYERLVAQRRHTTLFSRYALRVKRSCKP